ncbi:MAG TPA: HesA/MoeB/ThiF family protein [Bacteroidales bacterium]|nr:HesA/MoeB/ThiF family protein [Bacteroidales bacterium]
MIKKPLTEPELRRFRLQMNMQGINLEGQEKLKNARIAMIGLGGTGTNVLQYLSSLGVGYFAIIDNALVDELSIQRQSLYGGADLGKLKTIISRQRLLELYPLTEYEIINLRLDNSNIDRVLMPFDLIIDATNNSDSNYLINDACIRLNKPWVFTAVSANWVMFSVFNYNDGPSLRCFDKPIVYSTDVVISLSYGMAGLFASTEALKIITGQQGILQSQMLSFNCLDYTSHLSEIVKNVSNFEFIAN